MTRAQNWHTLKTSEFTQKAFRWLLPLGLCFVMTVAAQAETLHALLVIMDADQHVGPAVRANAQKVERLLTRVQDVTDLRVETRTLLSSQHQAQEAELMNWLETRRIRDTDVLFVYFSGQGGFAQEKELVYLQSGGMPSTDLAAKIQRTGTGRLKMLITDRCDALLKLPPENQQRHQASSSQLEDLFQRHQGFLHLTSTTDKEPGWADEDIGGLFTHALLQTMQTETEIASWRDTFDETRQQVKATFKRIYANLPDTTQTDLKNKGIDNQTPQAYQLPTRIGTSPPDNTADLWKLKNRESNFTLDATAEQPDYQIGELVTLNIEVTASAYVCIFNWESDGDFALIFPNKFRADNSLAPDRNHRIPERGAEYEFAVSAAPGTERFKVVAFRSASDSKRITRLAGSFRGDNKRMQAEISQHLRKMRRNDWAEDTVEIETRRSLTENVDLWKLKNRESNFTVDATAERPDYRIGERVTLNIEVTARAYVCIFNWESDGDFALIFPNKFRADNSLAPDRNHKIPERGADYEFAVSAAPGIERFKVVAFRDASDSDGITQLVRSFRGNSKRMRAEISQHLRKMRRNDWAEDTVEVKTRRLSRGNDYRRTNTPKVRAGNTPRAEEADKDPQNLQNIVFFKIDADGKYAYLAQLTDPDNRDAAKVAVHIFNEDLRKEHGDTLPKDWIIQERTEPKAGWGHRQIMLSFYRNEKWTFTTDVTVYEDHYLLPKKLNGNEDPIEGDREVEFGDIRIPIPVILK